VSAERARYLWERRKVIRRALRNLAAHALREPLRPRIPAGEEVVVVVCLNARGRTFNLGDMIRRYHGVRTILVTRIFDYAFQRQAFDEIRVFLRPGQLLRILDRIGRRHRVLAAIGSTQPAWQSRVLIDMPRRFPVLVDQYDSIWAIQRFARLGSSEMTGISAGYAGDEVREEEYCVRRADGLLMRLLTMRDLYDEAGIESPKISIPDGVNPRFCQPILHRSGSRGPEWSVVFAGIFYPMHFDPRRFGENQLVPLGPLFERERVHFHMYPTPHHDYAYPEYEAEAARNPYFHLHDSVSFGRVHREISQYDFGWLAMDFRNNMYYTERVRRDTGSIRFMTFLEAGLPVLVSDQTPGQARMVRETGGGIVLEDPTPRGLADLFRRADMEALLRGVERARAELSIERLSAPLIEFIRTVRRRTEARTPNRGRLLHR